MGGTAVILVCISVEVVEPTLTESKQVLTKANGQIIGLRPPRRRRKGPIECAGISGKNLMRVLALALTLSLAAVAAASAQTATPNNENGRYSFNPVADGVLRLDTRTGQVSQCSRSGVGWARKMVPDERAALETEVARLQGEIATLKEEL